MKPRSRVSPVSVLDPVDKSSSVLSDATVVGSEKLKPLVTVGDTVNNPALIHIRKQIEDLYAVCGPLNSKAVHNYLSNPNDVNGRLLAAWAKFGRNDRCRSVRIDLKGAAKTTLSPLGFACLISYARAWLDESELRAFAGQQAQPPAAQSPDDGSKRRQQGQLQPPPDLASGRRSRKRK